MISFALKTITKKLVRSKPVKWLSQMVFGVLANPIETQLICVFAAAVVFWAKVLLLMGIPPSGSILYNVDDWLTVLLVFFLCLAVFVFCFSVIVFAIVEYRNRNVE